MSAIARASSQVGPCFQEARLEQTLVSVADVLNAWPAAASFQMPHFRHLTFQGQGQLASPIIFPGTTSDGIRVPMSIVQVYHHQHHHNNDDAVRALLRPMPWDAFACLAASSTNGGLDQDDVTDE